MSTAEDSQRLEELFGGLTLVEAIRAMYEAMNEKEKQDEIAKEAGKKFDYLRLNLVPKLADDNGVTSMSVDDVGRMTIAGDLYVSIPANQKENAYQWLSDTGHGDLITTTINASTLKAAVKAMIVGGEELPEEMFKVTPFSRASITRVRK